MDMFRWNCLIPNSSKYNIPCWIRLQRRCISDTQHDLQKELLMLRCAAFGWPNLPVPCQSAFHPLTGI